jgi:tRNA threonylcarbamoyladenosine biosynthesis protein TsaB
MRLLALDTASGQCSAALLLDGELTVRDETTTRDHARLLLPMVDALLADAGLSLGALDGIAFGRGPGSFTGVRIAAAVTQGLAAGADLPVLPVSSLRALAEQARRRTIEQGAAPPGAWLACMDARMGEVYWGVFEPDVADSAECVSAPQLLAGLRATAVAGAAGKGLSAWPDIAVSLQLPADRVFAQAEPHALDVAQLALRDLGCGLPWLDAALAQPVYLRDQVTQVPKSQ